MQLYNEENIMCVLFRIMGWRVFNCTYSGIVQVALSTQADDMETRQSNSTLSHINVEGIYMHVHVYTFSQSVRCESRSGPEVAGVPRREWYPVSSSTDWRSWHSHSTHSHCPAHSVAIRVYNIIQ